MYFGWLKLHRQILDWEWYKNNNTKAVFLHLILSAGIAERRQQGFVLKPGELITTLPRLSNETGMTEKEIRTALKHLEKTGEISQKGTNKFRIITIEKWAFFQGDADETGRQRADNGQPKGSQRAGLEKEEKKETKKNVYHVRKNRFCNYEMRGDSGTDW